MAKIFRTAIKFIVETGTAVTVSSITKGLANAFIPKKTGISGTIQDVCVSAARFAITYRATDSMGNYVEEFYDENAKACKKLLNTINDIANEEENTDGETDAEETRATIEHSETSAD